MTGIPRNLDRIGSEYALHEESDESLVAVAGARGTGETPELLRRLKDSVQKLNATSNKQIDSIEKLNATSNKQIESIEKLNSASTKQQEEVIRLTRWIYRLTWVMAFVGIIQVVQIIVSFVKSH